MTHASTVAVGLCLLAAVSQGSPPGIHPGSGNSQGDAIVGGVAQGNAGALPPAAPVQHSPTTAAGTTGIAVNFDDLTTAPCLFFDTGPLRSEYAAQGLQFWGTSLLDGGAVLNACSGFSVSGYSAPNFLAFNSGASFPTGGVPKTPEFIRIVLPTAMSHVEVRAGTGISSGTLTLTGVGVNANVLDVGTITLGPALATVSIDSPGIVGVIISSTASMFVVDDFVAN